MHSTQNNSLEMHNFCSNEFCLYYYFWFFILLKYLEVEKEHKTIPKKSKKFIFTIYYMIDLSHL